MTKKLLLRWTLLLILFISLIILIQYIPESWNIPFEIISGCELLVIIAAALVYGRETLKLNAHLQALKERESEENEGDKDNGILDEIMRDDAKDPDYE